MSATYQTLLSEFIAFKSISTDPAFASDCEKTADWLVTQMQQRGFYATTWPGSQTNPTVFAAYEVDPTQPTILVYGHYDVQPAEQAEGWIADPFSVRETETHYYARGSIDNKGQVLVHIATVFDLIDAGTLGYNVKFLIEGNEESGNEDLPDIVATHKEDLSCDIVLISDGQIIGDWPLIERAFRGGGNLRIQLNTAANDLHSGLYGGAVPSASETLVALLATLHDEENRVIVPGFYTGVETITTETIAQNRELQDDTTAATAAGVRRLHAPESNDFLSQTGLQPALMISGINSGYTGIGYKNIVPAEAEARLNVRTVAGQTTSDIMDAIIAHLEASTPEYAEITIEVEAHGEPIQLSGNHPLFAKAENILKQTYGKPATSRYVGGSIPIIADLQRILEVPILSIPLAGEDCNMHGLEENFDKSLLQKAQAFADAFWKK